VFVEDLITLSLQTEQDIAEIASAGLNWVRLPIPFWAIDTWANEPFLAKTSWKSVIIPFRLSSCSKRVPSFLDTSSKPSNGAESTASVSNSTSIPFQARRTVGLASYMTILLAKFPIGYNHSGKGGQINFMMGTMGMANAQRAMNYIRIITEFISQPEWTAVVPMFGIMNEARIADIGSEQLRGLYVPSLSL